MSDAWDWIKQKASEAPKAVGSLVSDATEASGEAALGKALDVLDLAVGSIIKRGVPYDVTLEVTVGPLSLAVTVKGEQ